MKNKNHQYILEWKNLETELKRISGVKNRGRFSFSQGIWRFQ